MRDGGREGGVNARSQAPGLSRPDRADQTRPDPTVLLADGSVTLWVRCASNPEVSSGF